MNDLKLDSSYKEEFQKSLWTTYSIRFLAHERYLRQNRWSNISLGLMSCYSIIINLATLYNIPIGMDLSTNKISFYNTVLSILILLFSQLENSNDFKLKAEKFQSCALEIHEVYRKLKLDNVVIINNEELLDNLNKLTNEYNHILSKYENHKRIDYEIFKIENPDEEFKTNFLKCIYVRVNYYFNTIFIYHFLILTPIIIFLFANK